MARPHGPFCGNSPYSCYTSDASRMRSLVTACFVGLWLLVSCARSQPIPTRGQYSVSFKIVGGKLAVDRDAFLVTPSFVKFERAIRLSVGQAIAKMAALAPNMLGDSAWPDYIIAYQAWSAADPDRLDLGTLFSSNFLLANLLRQSPDAGLVMNEDQIDPLDGSISFSILPLVDANTVSIQLPAMLESRQRTRLPQIRNLRAPRNGALGRSTA